MKNSFGTSVSVTLFGESHGEMIGAVLDGLAPGIPVDGDFIASQLSLRRPSGKLGTARVERDPFQIVSGVFEGKTTGTPLTILIPNENTKSKDYAATRSLARPGHADYTAYCTLEIFAPEIKGLWSFSPFPGTLKEAGAVDNTYVCDTVQTVMMQGARDKDAAWEFMRWWNSTKSQLNYANTLESIMGAAARYPAADPDVIRQLPWSNRELTELLSQYGHLTGMPAVPGYYMNTRMTSYAFEDVVADLSSPRETLYLNIRDIDNELTKKRTEFGLSTVDTWEGEMNR